MEQIGNIRGLRHICITNVWETGWSPSALSRCNELERLNIDADLVPHNEETIQQISAIKKLRILGILSTDANFIDSDFLAQLRRAMPNCQVSVSIVRFYD